MGNLKPLASPLTLTLSHKGRGNFKKYSLPYRSVGIALAVFEPNVDFFLEQLASIQAQNHPNWTCLLSFDSPMEPIQRDPRFSPFLEDRRFLWFQNKERLGFKKNFERAIQKILGHDIDVVALADQDDIWYPDKLETLLKELKKRPPLSLVHSDMDLLIGNQKGEKTVWKTEKRNLSSNRVRDLLLWNIATGSSMLFDAKLARSYPAIPEGIDHHDHWFALLAAAHGGVYPIKRPLMAYRQHGKNVIGLSPFKPLKKFRSYPTLKAFLFDLRRLWNESGKRAYGLTRLGIRLSLLNRILFCHEFDLGLGLIGVGILHCFKSWNRSLILIAAGLGKSLTLLTLRTK